MKATLAHAKSIPSPPPSEDASTDSSTRNNSSNESFNSEDASNDHSSVVNTAYDLGTPLCEPNEDQPEEDADDNNDPFIAQVQELQDCQTILIEYGVKTLIPQRRGHTHDKIGYNQMAYTF